MNVVRLRKNENGKEWKKLRKQFRRIGDDRTRSSRHQTVVWNSSVTWRKNRTGLRARTIRRRVLIYRIQPLLRETFEMVTGYEASFKEGKIPVVLFYSVSDLLIVKDKVHTMM